jgi:hypothetical protein
MNERQLNSLRRTLADMGSYLKQDKPLAEQRD